MHVAELWRYPVKSMAGQRLQQATLGPLGIAGDRLAYVTDDRGVILTARNHPALLLLLAGIDAQGQPTVNGKPWTDASVADLVRAAAGESARLVLAQAGERFDILPLLVATDGAIAAQGVDRRRFRPNLLIGGVEGQTERTWQGKALRIGDALIALTNLRARCVMTTWDPDTIEQDKRVLLNIIAKQDGTLALNAWAAKGGTIHVGDPVALIEDPNLGEPPVRGRIVM